MEELRDLLSLDTLSKDLHVREDNKGNTGMSILLVRYFISPVFGC